jgi:hypothetical protein
MRRENGNQKRYCLIEDMMKGAPLAKEAFEEHLRLLEELKSGVLEGQ